MSMGKTNNDNHRHKLKEEDNKSKEQFWEEGHMKNRINNDFNMLYVLLIQLRQKNLPRNLYIDNNFQNKSRVNCL